MALVGSRTAKKLWEIDAPLFIMPKTVEYVLREGDLTDIKVLYSTLKNDFAIKGPDDQWLPFENDLVNIVLNRNFEIKKWFFTSSVRVCGEIVSVFRRGRSPEIAGLSNAASAEALWPAIADWSRWCTLQDWSTFAISSGDLELFKWCEPKLLEDEWQIDVINKAVEYEQVAIARYIFDKYNVGANSTSILALIGKSNLEMLEKMRPFVTGNVNRDAMYAHALLSNDIKTLQWVYNFVGKPRKFYIRSCTDLHAKSQEVVTWLVKKKLITTKTEIGLPVGVNNIPFYDLALEAGFEPNVLFKGEFLDLLCGRAYSPRLMEYVLERGITQQQLAHVAAKQESIDMLNRLYDLGYRVDDEFCAYVRASGRVAVKAWLFDHA